jgi:3D (Asp-Asp-Asp) domain-containing protein
VTGDQPAQPVDDRSGDRSETRSENRSGTRGSHRTLTFGARLLVLALAGVAVLHPFGRTVTQPGTLLRHPPAVVSLRVPPLVVHPPPVVRRPITKGPLAARPLAARPRPAPFRPLHERARAGERIPVQVTAYCLHGTTRRGNPTRPGIVAADPKFFPLSRHVELYIGTRHVGRFLVDDTGGRIRGPILDLWTESCDDARQFGRRRGFAMLH